MGSFFTNLQVRNSTTPAVRDALVRLKPGRGYLSPLKDGWVTVYLETTEDQDTKKLSRLAENLSRTLKTDVFAFLVHDSDIAAYWLHRCGDLMDEFNSSPDYFDDSIDEAERARVRGSIDVLLPLCIAGTTRQQLEAVVHPQDGFAIMAEETLCDLAPLLGIDPDRVAVGFEYFDREGAELLADADEFEPLDANTPRKTKQPVEEGAGPAATPSNFDCYSMAVGLLTHIWQEQFEQQVQLSARFGVNAEDMLKKLRDGFDRGARDLLKRAPTPGLPSLDELRAARDQGPDALAVLIASRTPAHLAEIGVMAAGAGLEEFVAALLKVGLKPREPNARGRTTLEAAAQHGLNSSIHRLVQSAADADDGRPPGN